MRFAGVDMLKEFVTRPLNSVYALHNKPTMLFSISCSLHSTHMTCFTLFCLWYDMPLFYFSPFCDLTLHHQFRQWHINSQRKKHNFDWCWDRWIWRWELKQILSLSHNPNLASNRNNFQSQAMSTNFWLQK